MSKKSFKDNPALQFMSRAEDLSNEAREKKREEKAEVAEVVEIKEVKEARMVMNDFLSAPVAFEAKSKRFNMLIRPSTYEKLKKIAEYRCTSVNDLINTIVESYMEFDGK